MEREKERERAVKRSSVIQSPTHGRCVIRRPVFIGTLRLVSHLDLMARPRYTVARMSGLWCVERGKKSGGDSEEAVKERKTVGTEALTLSERTNVSCTLMDGKWNTCENRNVSLIVEAKVRTNKKERI